MTTIDTDDLDALDEARQVVQKVLDRQSDSDEFRDEGLENIDRGLEVLHSTLAVAIAQSDEEKEVEI